MKSMATGTIVARMIDPARMRRAAWRVYHTAMGLPHDACIHVARSPLVFYDQGWQSSNEVPEWYRQNHAKEGVANVRMTILDADANPHQQVLVWRTTRAVSRGEELRFTYTDVPREWDHDASVGKRIGDDAEIKAVMEGLHRLNVMPTDMNGGGNKRKAARSHFGLPIDSANTVRIVALSRVMATREDFILEASAATQLGVAFITSLQQVVVRVAIAVGGATPALTLLNIQSFFGMSASNVRIAKWYDANLTLPSRLPHANAKKLLEALLETLSALHADQTTYPITQRLLRVPAPVYDAQAASDLAEVVDAIEVELTTRLSGGGDERATRRSRGGASSSGDGHSGGSRTDCGRQCTTAPSGSFASVAIPCDGVALGTSGEHRCQGCSRDAET